MQSISLNKPGTFSHTIEFPSTWDELTNAEVELVAKQQLSANAQLTQNENLFIGKALVFTALIDSRAALQNIQLPADWKTNLNYDDAATQGFDAIGFLYKENNRTINPYPQLTVGGKRMIGPADDFNEITCGEMEDCEVFFMLFSQEPSLELLAKIAAVLWRPRNAPYNAKASESRVARFKSLPPEVLFAIYIWYTGCRNQLPKIFKEVYAGGDSQSNEPDVTAFTKCIHAGAGAKNGTRDKIRIMPAKEFLFDMNLEAINAKAIAAQYESK